MIWPACKVQIFNNEIPEHVNDEYKYEHKVFQR